ncbi:MAG: excinuclease ABC subunit UvrB [Flavobacteriaceae bacterium]|nr:excinuclease ABC subunit UvrB [Flavobacteriaceae bacterium]MBL6684486.1 excinuclease ABC subunit UvrB [Flavobacteriaceae bacterium]
MLFKFSLISKYTPAGDQPEAINKLVNGINNNEKFQTLEGVTGSGKTFTIANVLQKVNKPTLVLAHNKTLAAQLYSELKEYFPNNLVEYFVSYYDYYQPEAFIPVTNTYIEKDLSINDEIEKLRLSTTTSLLSGRRDVIVVASVSCLYGIGNPIEYKKNTINIDQNVKISRTELLKSLVNSLYSRAHIDFEPGTFRVQGDIIEVYLSYRDSKIRFNFFGDEIESIEEINQKNKNLIESVSIFPANMFATQNDVLFRAMDHIRIDLGKQVNYFKEIGKHLEAKRLEERTLFDLEMMQELGYCSGIENYSRYIDGREPGTRPFCLIDYFPDDFITVIDESHVTIPQIRAMYGGDRSRKENLVEYGFRLPAAMDNRPLKFEEFELLQNQIIYVSATPSDYELIRCEGIIVEQIIRPTGLLDPEIEIKETKNQIDDIINELQDRINNKERVLITTLTKKMSEELVKYLIKVDINSRYIHSDIDTIERIEILNELRSGKFDVLVGVNLLREGLDLPEVSLVIILDADKEGFLRSKKSLIQTIGRAARNINGKAIMYADKITKSMQETIDLTKKRRAKQELYNLQNKITPKQIIKNVKDTFEKEKITDNKSIIKIDDNSKVDLNITKAEKEKLIREIRKQMEDAAKELNFLEAARLRDLIDIYKKSG